jgi:hypothetical protein
VKGCSVQIETSLTLQDWQRNQVNELSRVTGEDGFDRVTVNLLHFDSICFVRLVLERE